MWRNLYLRARTIDFAPLYWVRHMRSSTFHLWPWLVPSRLCATRTAGARRFPPSHDIPRSTRGSLRETTEMSQPLTRVASDLFSEHAKSQLKHSRFCLVNNAPPSPTLPSPLGGLLRDETKTAACETSKCVASQVRKRAWRQVNERLPFSRWVNKNLRSRRLFELCHTFLKTS